MGRRKRLRGRIGEGGGRQSIGTIFLRIRVGVARRLITTMGSDIVPVHPVARSVTTAEGTVGQLFPAILIGALVAMAMESRSKS